MEERYNFKEIEKKWQKVWEDRNTFKVTEDPSMEKFYCLEMFPYPSGKLHMGHVRNYSIGDVVARFKKMDGYNVLHPMGFDSFGLPAENAAIQHGIHPSTWTWDNIHEMERQLRELGLSYDWDRECCTCSEEYYRWMQWIFIQFYKRGLAYKKENPVNWCPSCQTVLANEQVVDGVCERCKTPVTKKNLSQWYFKITDYADRLLENLDNGKLEGWPQKVRLMQKNWIGRSYGCEVDFKVKDSDEVLTVFTTRVDTIYGTTFMVLAPEYPTVLENVKGTEYEKDVLDYIERVNHMNEIERTSTTNEKTGVFIGKYAINPFTHKEMPIFISPISNVRPPTSASGPSRALPISRCPLEETGRYSVRPWTMPRISACNQSILSYLFGLLIYIPFLAAALYTNAHNHKEIAEETKVGSIDDARIAEHVRVEMVRRTGRTTCHDKPNQNHQGCNAHDDEVDLS